MEEKESWEKLYYERSAISSSDKRDIYGPVEVPHVIPDRVKFHVYDKKEYVYILCQDLDEIIVSGK